MLLNNMQVVKALQDVPQKSNAKDDLEIFYNLR